MLNDCLKKGANSCVNSVFYWAWNGCQSSRDKKYFRSCDKQWQLRKGHRYILTWKSSSNVAGSVKRGIQHQNCVMRGKEQTNNLVQTIFVYFFDQAAYLTIINCAANIQK